MNECLGVGAERSWDDLPYNTRISTQEATDQLTQALEIDHQELERLLPELNNWEGPVLVQRRQGKVNIFPAEISAYQNVPWCYSVSVATGEVEDITGEHNERTRPESRTGFVVRKAVKRVWKNPGS